MLGEVPVVAHSTYVMSTSTAGRDPNIQVAESFYHTTGPFMYYV